VLFAIAMVLAMVGQLCMQFEARHFARYTLHNKDKVFVTQHLPKR